ncbi:MgpA, DHH family phosphoesterase [Mycoplasma ovis str. Michigan]|uniref:MgpA, DHH family phosphoesterase n=2 Tax=Mycoplasma ovis TaxID=171632 RepID=A0ABM5P095_9MOLU|nr:MgpA, DHH family phosphoesterase [Mycoplasma ovis str. Michigan]
MSKISLATFSAFMGKLLNKKQVEEDKFISEKAKERDNFLKQFPHYINAAKQIVIFPHVNPDGDCLGGAFGMRETLRAQFSDKNIYVVGTSQGIFPWLEMDFDEIPLDFDYSSSLALIVDSGTSDRVQRFQDFFGNPETQKWGAVIRVDHHDNKQDYHTDLSWVDTSYAACCGQLFQICDYYQWHMPKRAATFFYLGLLTDSGFFSNAEVSPRTFVIAAKALRAGADREFLISNLKRTHELEARLKGYILENFVQEERFAWFFMKNEAVEKFKPYSLTSNQVTSLSNIEDNVMWILLAEASATEIRVSFRSVGTFDVKKIAEEFGGGGHFNASGTTLTSPDQVKALITRARKLVKEFIEHGGGMSKDVLAEQAKEEFDKQINPAYRLDLTPEEKISLDEQRELIEQTHNSLASQEKIREAESIVNSDKAFDSFLDKPETFSDVKVEDDSKIATSTVLPEFDDSEKKDSQ